MATATTARRDHVVAAIASALIQVLEYDLPEITEDSRLFDQLGLDSTGVFELLMRLEEALEVEFDTDSLEMVHFETVRTLADFVVSETGA
jgi:acyl carrier protein